jgi:hypothetical protein
MVKTETKTRVRRSADERVAALETEIEAIREREATRAALQAEHLKFARQAVSAVVRASRAATEAGDADLAAFLDEAAGDVREILAERGVVFRPRTSTEPVKPTRRKRAK